MQGVATCLGLFRLQQHMHPAARSVGLQNRGYKVGRGKVRKHPKRDGKSNKELYSDISSTPVSAIVDSRANGVLITPATAKRKGLLDQIDSSHQVTINQANADQKFETFGTLEGGVPFQMKSVHGRTLTIRLASHATK